MNIGADTGFPNDIHKDFEGERDSHRNDSFVPDKQRPLRQQQQLCTMMHLVGAAFRLTHPRVPVTRVPVPGTG